MRLTILACAIVFATTAMAASKTKTKTKPDERVEFLIHAHELVAAKLLDPPSARFVSDSLVRDVDGQLQYACGFVQGKNSFGGYAQPALYAAEPSTGRVFIVHNHLTDDDARDPSYAEGMKFMQGACSKDAAARMEEAPALPATTQ